MGTRTNILADHQVPDHLDRTAVVSRLAPTLSATIAVRDYWISTHPDEPGLQADFWTATPELAPPHKKLVFYEGPGGFLVGFGSSVVNVRSSARWRGFLSIETTRQVLLPAFRCIARTLGSSRLAYLPDDDEIIFAATTDGASLDDCIADMGRKWGPPQASLESLDPDVIQATGYGVPAVWYLEMVSDLLIAGVP